MTLSTDRITPPRESDSAHSADADPTGSAPSHYIGRFAPSPTGPLHFGSLLAALASYLDARSHHGHWLLRIEDLDPPREDPNAASSILAVLDAYQLHWDGEVRYQSQRSDAYEALLEQLCRHQLVFPCRCSRKQLQGRLHLNGDCVNPIAPSMDKLTDCAWRLRIGADEQAALSFEDQLQGHQALSPARDIGDFVVRRRDGLWSYQLAVVCDDHDQGVNRIVRGIDLMDSTQRQMLLYRALQWDIPLYAHIPVAVERNGQKLSKQNLARPLAPDDSGHTLWRALDWLQQQPPRELQRDGNARLLQWAIEHWQPQVLRGMRQLPAPSGFQRPDVSD